jgi:hypothetical protein
MSLTAGLERSVTGTMFGFLSGYKEVEGRTWEIS